jgi:DNA-directed RNA polymerase specialized sigma24 family protein
MDDSEIVATIAAGDPAGLAAAYDKYASAVYGYCRWMLREPAPAADALVDTFVAAATELAGLEDAIAARALLYATARNECHRQLTAASSADPAGFRNPQHEAGLLSIRHGLSEAELAAVLEVPWQEAHNLAARAREHLVPPSIALLDHVPPPLHQQILGLQEQVLSRAAVSAPARSGDTEVIPVGSGDTEVIPARSGDTEVIPARSGDTGVIPVRSPWPAGGQRLGKLRAWRMVRANPGAAIGIAAIVMWVAAAASAVLITLIGLQHVRVLAIQTHERRTAAISPADSRSVSPGPTASPSPSPGPTSRAVPQITTRPSPAHPSSTQPTQSPSASPSASASPSSASPSLSPSPSSSPSSSPSPKNT